MSSIHEQIEACIRLSLKGENQRALAEIDKIINAGSGGPEGDPAYAYFAKGNILNRLGRHNESVAALRTAATLEHNNDSILFNLGMEEIAIGNKQRGREYLERAAQLGSEKAQQAIKAINDGGPIVAGDGGGVVVIGDSEDEKVSKVKVIATLLARGVASVESQRYEDAIIEYNKVIKLDPTFGQTYTLRGNAHGKLGNYDQSLKDHGRAIELDPSNAVAYYNRGLIYEKMSQKEKALQDYTKAIELDDSDADFFYNRGTVYNSMGRFGESIPDFSRAIELNPKYSMAYNNRGNAHMHSGKLDAAMADFASAIKIEPREPLFYISKGLCCIYLGKSQDAQVHFQKAMEIDPQRALKLIQRVKQQLNLSQG